MAEICGKRLMPSLKFLKNLTNGLNMFEMTYIFGKFLKYLRNG